RFFRIELPVLILGPCEIYRLLLRVANVPHGFGMEDGLAKDQYLRPASENEARRGQMGLAFPNNTEDEFSYQSSTSVAPPTGECFEIVREGDCMVVEPMTDLGELDHWR